MSTRATYQFKSSKFGSVTFYIHSDGYLKGAAEYLYNAAAFNNAAAHGTLADNFFRANPKAELTGSHEAHGDTEFRYTFYITFEGKLSKWCAEARDVRNDVWNPVGSGRIEDLVSFINKERGRWDEDTEDDTVVSIHPGYLTTLRRAGEKLASLKAEAAEYAVKFPQYAGNIRSYEEQIARLETAIGVAAAGVTTN